MLNILNKSLQEINLEIHNSKLHTVQELISQARELVLDALKGMANDSQEQALNLSQITPFLILYY
jgi:vacuolar-type H+-ATPase subunit E/Vma4